jgi:hypothetical protein
LARVALGNTSTAMGKCNLVKYPLKHLGGITFRSDAHKIRVADPNMILNQKKLLKIGKLRGLIWRAAAEVRVHRGLVVSHWRTLSWRPTSSIGGQRYAQVQLVRRATAYSSIWLHIGGAVVGDNG